MGAGATPVSTLHKAGSEKTKASEGTFYGQVKEKPGEAIPLRPKMGPLIPASRLCGWKDPCVNDSREWGSGSSCPSLALCSRHGSEVQGAAGWTVPQEGTALLQRNSDHLLSQRI